MPTTVDLPLTPMPMQGVPNPGYGATDLRRYLGLGLREGVFTVADYVVTQKATPGMAVEVSAGDALVQGDSVSRQGLYHCVNENPLNGVNEVTIPTADGTLPRVDQVILEVKDTQYDGSGLNRARVRLLQGTPTSGANRENRLGVASVPSSALLLYDIEVAQNQASVVAANIVDKRPLAAMKYDVGDVKFNVGDTPAGAMLGWARANLQQLSRTIFSALYAISSTTHGAGNGTTTFNVADLMGRSAMGSGTGAGLTARAVGSRIGTESEALSLSQLPGMPQRMANAGLTVDTATAASGANDGLLNSYDARGTARSGGSTVGGGQTHNNLSPSTVLSGWVFHGLAQEKP